MKTITLVVLSILMYTVAFGQASDVLWYSKCIEDDILIHSSYPKGGPYLGPTDAHFNHSYLVFFHHVKNESDHVVDLSLHFSEDAIPIPNSPGTFMRLIIPSDTMTWEKYKAFSYGVEQLAYLDRATSLSRRILPQEEYLFYTVAFFYQNQAEAWDQGRGGHRMELIARGQQLYVNMPPQVESLSCGQIRPAD